ncbi:uncharacterized protein LOC135126227 isoform X2 [Zophobas morio]|uniref:uncharacterized protein LOC135126227 isoform X2 n=1 Tax=Zophobas morio TaxID=2755281 RepID=UPI0030838112
MYVIRSFLTQTKIKILTDVILLCNLFKNINGIKDASTPQTSINSCTLPPHPRFGGWTAFQTNLAPSVGDAVPVGTILEISCYYGYKLNGGAISACIRGQWRPEVGQCLRTCPSLRTTTITTVSCIYKGETLATCLDVVEGTRAHFQCSPFYEIQGLNKFPVRICSRGQWSGGIPECVPVCGKKGITKDPTLIVGGFNTTSLEYPWQTALYFKRTKVLICGGTLLSQKTILTAAHCVTNDKGQLQPKENYIVAVGKSYRSYNDSRDNAAQFSSIEEMYVSRQYKGYIQHYFGDIAIIVVNTTFVLSLNVQPVCVVWEKKFHQSLENITRVNQTYASGWGFTSENKNPSDVLKSLKVPLIGKDECERSLSEDDLEYLTDDKLCAGFLESGKSVCKGDSGGGLVTKHGGRYYIIAVVSIAPQSSTAIGGCDSQQYGLYTRFSYYIEDFLIDVEARFAPSEHHVYCTSDDCFTASTNASITSARSGCILPDHPTFGNWSILGASSNHFMPGTLVVPGTVLKIECKLNYTLSGHSSVFCEKELWSSNVGECLGAALNTTAEDCFLSSAYGCCPDNLTTATGPNNAGCGCEYTTHGCCPDDITPARGSNYTGCGCVSSKNFEGCEIVPENLQERCSLSKERGSCRNHSIRWFFDMDYGGCSRFWYGGCDGNANRFKTQEECVGICVNPEGLDRCKLPKVSGPCEKNHSQWFYEAEGKHCAQFIYGGCLGNNNRFETREECLALCVKNDSVGKKSG